MSTELYRQLRHAIKAASHELHVAYVPNNNRGHKCSLEHCGNLAYAKGLCNAHYLRLRQGRDLSEPIQRRNRFVTCLECDKKVDGKGGWGLCKGHYRSKRYSILKSVCVEYLGGACQHCGGKFPSCVYDFHHLDGADKFGDPSSLTSNGSLAVIAREVAKCALLCANCHRIVHGSGKLRQSIITCSEA